MSGVKIKSDPAVKQKFKSYPKDIIPKMNHLRDLILETIAAHPTIGEIEETLKWGEPSYLAKKGSTLRMDWKKKAPHQYAMYFKCTSKLVVTFKEVFGDTFRYENNRAILFNLEDDIPRKELMECIRLTLQYHTVKNLPKLGM